MQLTQNIIIKYYANMCQNKQSAVLRTRTTRGQTTIRASKQNTVVENKLGRFGPEHHFHRSTPTLRTICHQNHIVNMTRAIGNLTKLRAGTPPRDTTKSRETFDQLFSELADAWGENKGDIAEATERDIRKK